MRDASPFTLTSLNSIVSAAKSMLAKHDPPLLESQLRALDDVLWVKRVEDLELAEATWVYFCGRLQTCI